MGKLTLVIGGARSGKSRYAVELARSVGDGVVFVATCVVEDAEMRERVERHHRSRPCTWKTVEEPHDVAAALQRVGAEADVVVVDCLTLLVSNLMAAGLNDEQVEEQATAIVATARRVDCHTILVSNDVGCGVVPDNALARRFRDLAGRVNQLVAAAAVEVVMLVAGVPVAIKGDGK